MEGEERRDRLARLQLERMSRPPRRSSRASLNHLIDRWRRFMAASGWEKAFFAGAILLIAGLAIGGFFMLTTSTFGGAGGNKNVAAGAPHATSTPRGARPTPTTIVIGVPTLPTAKPADRTNCAQLAGTSYNSNNERLFFEQNCITPTEQPTGTPTPPPSSDRAVASPTQPRPPSPLPPTQAPPPPQPQPSPTFTASDAINAGVYWMSHTAGYSVDPATCNAFDTGSHWVVTCSASSGSGQSTLSVCVFADPLRVVSSDQC